MITKALIATVLSIAAAPAKAAILMTFAQAGTDVTLTASGSLNMANVVFFENTVSRATSWSASGIAVVGPQSSDKAYRLSINAGVFGTGANTFATSSAGDPFGLNTSTNSFFVTADYVSGSTIAGTARFANQTLASLGLTTGTYVYSLPADTITLVVPAALTPVPEAPSWAMMIVGMGFVGYAIRRCITTTRLPA